MKKSITVTVPAYNEEENLEVAVKGYDKIVKKLFKDYEILIFNDGSTDRTGKIADKLAKANPRVRVIHNKGNKGLGYNFRKGVELSKKYYYTIFLGEGEVLRNSIKKLLDSVGKADIIISYIGNPKIRPLYRRIISNTFTTLINLLFGLHIKYYNGYVIHKTKILKGVKMTTNSFAYQAEALIQLLKDKKAYSYIEVPYITKKTTGSSCFRIKNLIGVGSTIIRLFFKIYFGKKR